MIALTIDWREVKTCSTLASGPWAAYQLTKRMEFYAGCIAPALHRSTNDPVYKGMTTSMLTSRMTETDTDVRMASDHEGSIAMHTRESAAVELPGRLRVNLDGLRVRRGFDAALTRAFDFSVALILLLLLLPVILIAVVLVRLDSPGPAFFRTKRAGFRGTTLRMLKFRKMHDGATGLALTANDDQRFTRVGAWMAKTKIDEIPQLWHVLRGEMSLVGPRPEDPRFVAGHPEDFEHILAVRPGVTGYSQIAFAQESRILDDEDPVTHYVDRLLPQKLAMDRMYADHRSLLVDLKVLFWTTAAVLLRRQVAVNRKSGKMNLRQR